jgi:hypothetical protein
MAFVGHKSVAVHLGYMRGAKQPDQHQNVLEKPGGSTIFGPS